MTSLGTIVIDVLAVALGVLIFQLVRSRMLTVGWGLLWTLPLLGLIVFLNIPPLLGWFTQAVGAKFPVSALSLIGFVFLFLSMILLCVQVCRLKARQVELIQRIGLSEVLSLEDEADQQPPDG